jgi:hypothetical protein
MVGGRPGYPERSEGSHIILPFDKRRVIPSAARDLTFKVNVARDLTFKVNVARDLTFPKSNSRQHSAGGRLPAHFNRQGL